VTAHSSLLLHLRPHLLLHLRPHLRPLLLHLHVLPHLRLPQQRQ
jgi:hypothetical protein